MTSVLLVGLALAGVCAYVWSAIVQAEGPSAARTDGGLALPRAIAGLKHAAVRLRAARRQRRAARIERALELGPRRLRFEDTAAPTTPGAAMTSTARIEEEPSRRPSRLLSAVQLVLLTVLLGVAAAAVALGLARVVSRLLATH